MPPEHAPSWRTGNAPDYYDLIRGQIEHEDELSTNRVIWLLLSEAFFITAYATLLNGQAGDDLIAAQRRLLLWMVPVAGLVAGLAAYLAVIGSVLAAGALRGLYEQVDRKRHRSEQTDAAYPPIQGPLLAARLTRISVLTLPLVFFVVWIIILVSQLIHG